MRCGLNVMCSGRGDSDHQSRETLMFLTFHMIYYRLNAARHDSENSWTASKTKLGKLSGQ